MSTPSSLLEQPLYDLYTARYTQVAPTVWLVYYYLLTFSNEVELFWNRKWSIPQLLFFLIRYPPIAWEIFLGFALISTHLSTHFCNVWGHQILVVSGATVICTVHAILILRLYGLYGSKALLYFLCILLCVAFSAEVYIAVRFSPIFMKVDLGPGVGNVCASGNLDKMCYIWIPVLTFEFVVFLLALNKGIEQFRSGAMRVSRLMQIILRDSFAYFFLIIAVDIVNLIGWIYLRESLRSVTLTFTWSLMSVLGSQMLVNIRLGARPGEKDTHSTYMTPASLGSGISFGRGQIHSHITSETHFTV